MTSLKLLVWRLNEPSPLAHEVILPSPAIFGVLVLVFVLEERTAAKWVGVYTGLANRVLGMGDENLVWMARANADVVGLVRVRVRDVNDMYCRYGEGVVGVGGLYMSTTTLCNSQDDKS
jgi:hypothetical protein